MSCPAKIANSFDLFGIRPTVYYDGKLKSGTGFGFLLTVLLLTFTAVCFGYFGQDLYYRLNPIMRYHEEYTPLPESITLDPEIYPIVIEMNSASADVYYTNPNLIKMTVGQLTITQNSNSTNVSFEEYPMETCREDHFDKLDDNTRTYFLHKVLSDYFCIPKNLKNLTMQGAFDQNIFQTIKFTVYVCSNETSGGKCLPNEEIKQKMGRGFIGIYFADSTVNPENYLLPKKSQPKEVFTNFVLDSQKQIDVFLQNNYITTEDGIIFQNSNVERVYNFDSSAQYDLRTENPDFFMVYFKIKQGNAYYERSYRKLQDLLAQIGGFINCFWIIMFSINYFYSNLSMIANVIANVFSIRVFKNLSNNNKNSPKDNLFSIKIDNQEPKDQLKKEFELPALQVSSRILTTSENKFMSTEKKEEFEDRVNEFVMLDGEKNEVEKKESINFDLKEENKAEKQLELINFSSKSIPIDNPVEYVDLNSAYSTQKIAEIQKLQKLEEEIKNFEAIEDLQFGVLDYLHYYTGCFKSPERQRKKMIINKGSQILRTCLDIKYIIQKFYEIEKLKQILLTEVDLEKFTQLPKPELRVVAESTNTSMKETVITNVFAKQVNFVKENENTGEKKNKIINLKKKSKFSKGK